MERNVTHRGKMNPESGIGLIKRQREVCEADELDARRGLRDGLNRTEGDDVINRPTDDKGVNRTGVISLAGGVPDHRIFGQRIVLGRPKQ